MRHEFIEPPAKNLAERFHNAYKRMCKHCRKIQHLHRQHNWGRVIHRQWLPLIGRCKGRKK